MSHTSDDQKRISVMSSSFLLPLANLMHVALSSVSVILVFFNFIPFFFSLLIVRYLSYFALLHLDILCDIEG